PGGLPSSFFKTRRMYIEFAHAHGVTLATGHKAEFPAAHLVDCHEARVFALLDARNLLIRQRQSRHIAGRRFDGERNRVGVGLDAVDGERAFERHELAVVNWHTGLPEYCCFGIASTS